MENEIKKWNKKAADLLVGRTIKAASYMTAEEQEDSGYYKKALVIQLDNGMLLWPSRDDEGNDAGAIHYITKDKGFDILPVM